MKTKKKLYGLLAVLLALALGGCGNPSGGGDGPESGGPEGGLPLSATPSASVISVIKTSATQKYVGFTLTSTHTGTWKVYGGATGGSPLTNVTASFSAPTLTLGSTGSDLAAGVYYVSVTGEGKSESGRLTLVVQSFGAPALGGAVSIGGAAQVGQTLTANTGGLTGLSGTLVYQWKAGVDTVGTNTNTYSPAEADLGKTITVAVISTGNTGSVTSAPTTAVDIFRVTYTDLADYLATINGDSAASPVTV
jgi:hypothetical protein